MRVTTAHVGGLLLWGIWLLAGCRTVAPEAPPAGWDPEVDALEPDRALFADVLAHYAAGLVHDMNREYDLALSEYLEAVKLDPENEELHFRIAMGLLHENQSEEAIRMMVGLVERRPDSSDALMWLALLYRAADRPVEAIETYNRVIGLDPSAAEPYLDLASYHLLLDQPDEAIDVLAAGARKAREPLELLVSLGQVHDRLAAEADEDEERSDRLAEAIRAYERASKLADEDTEIRAEILLTLGRLQIRNGQPEQAVQTYARLERLFPEDLKVKRQLALSFQEVGDVDTAISSLEALSREEPSNARLYYYLGELYHEQGDTDEAIRCLTEATTAAKKDPTAFVRLAQIQIDENPAAAIATLHRGLDQMREQPLLTEILAYAYLDDEDYAKALDWMTRAEFLLGDEADGRFYFNYARAAYFAGHNDTVIRCLARALEDSWLYLLAFMQEILSLDEPDLDDAIALFQALVEQDDDEPAVYKLLGQMKSYNNQFEEAVADFERVERLVREDREQELLLDDEYYFSYAAALERSGRIEKAEEFFLKTLEMRPDHDHARNYLAYMWAERGIRLDEALEHVNVALSVTPDSGAYLDTLGWIYYQQGKYDEALVEIQRADELEPEDPTISDHLGDTLEKLGRMEEAVAYWRRSLEIDPENEKVEAKVEAAEAALAEAAEPDEVPEEAPESDVPESEVPEEPAIEPVPAGMSEVEDAAEEVAVVTNVLDDVSDRPGEEQVPVEPATGPGS